MSEPKSPSNPSRKATDRVKNPLPVPTSCHLCGGVVRIGTHEEVYGTDYSEWPYVYICESCKSYVGLHPFTNIPLGTLADKNTRNARKNCKKPFEQLWRNGKMSRAEAYQWLADKMGIPVNECHFGWFDIKQFQEAMNICIKEIGYTPSN
jgi:hypothetical protein